MVDGNTPTLWVWSLPVHTLRKNPQATAWKDTAGGVRQRRGGETHTYVEVCGTVKAILIGHHTSGETEWQGGIERGRGGGNQDESGVVRPHVGIDGTGRENGAMIEGREIRVAGRL